MKKLLTTALLALTAALTAGAQSRTEVYTFPSEVLGAEKSCTVYLPDGYDRSQESYPVLYLLHGASGCQLVRCSPCAPPPAPATPTGPRRATCAASPTKPSLRAWPGR